MKFKQLPTRTEFVLNQILHKITYKKICPIYADCCTIRYNAQIITRSGIENVYIDPETEVTTTLIKSQVLKERGEKMKRLRHIPMNEKFVLNDKIYTRVDSALGRDEDGNEVKLNKNTEVEEVVEETDEKTYFDVIEELDEILEETNAEMEEEMEEEKDNYPEGEEEDEKEDEKEKDTIDND